jgi:hypothetical protein
MRLCDPVEALGQVWHILEVLEGSPAEVSRHTAACTGTSFEPNESMMPLLPGIECRYASATLFETKPDSQSMISLIGLVPYGDYILGYTEGPLHTESDFYDLVEHVSDGIRYYSSPC